MPTRSVGNSHIELNTWDNRTKRATYMEINKSNKQEITLKVFHETIPRSDQTVRLPQKEGKPRLELSEYAGCAQKN